MSAEILTNSITKHTPVEPTNAPVHMDFPLLEEHPEPVRLSPAREDMPVPHILRLSTELVEWIAGYAAISPAALLNLRLTCKDLNARTEKVVAKSYFVNRAFLIKHPGSLSTLYEISQHRVFARSMKRVRFSRASLCFTCCSWDANHAKRDKTDQGCETFPTELQRRHSELWKSMADFHKNDYALATIREALINFRRKGIVLALSLTDHIIEGHDSSYNELCQTVGHKRFVPADHDDTFRSRSCATLLRAIEGADYPITNLELDNTSTSQAVNLCVFSPEVPPVASQDEMHRRLHLLRCCPSSRLTRYEPYGHLKSLQICTSWTPIWHPSSCQQSAEQLRPSLADFFSQLGNLKCLILTHPFRPYRYPLPDRNYVIVQALVEAAKRVHESGGTPLKSLHTVVLTGYRVAFDDLRDLIVSTRRTLALLSIQMLSTVSTFPVGFEEILRKAHGGSGFKVESRVYDHEEYLR